MGGLTFCQPPGSQPGGFRFSAGSISERRESTGNRLLTRELTRAPVVVTGRSGKEAPSVPKKSAH